jgi:hypothetical protein
MRFLTCRLTAGRGDCSSRSIRDDDQKSAPAERSVTANDPGRVIICPPSLQGIAFMTMESGKESFRLGFLTAIEVPERGFIGGLLVTNHFGRPLEFQCTAPLKPNRAQEILYGPTLVPYVLGDLIGRTLIEKVGVKPHLVLTERNDLLTLRDLVSIPVACVDDFRAAATAADSGTATQAEGETETTPSPAAAAQFRLGRQILRFHAAHADDQAVARQGAASVPADADLREPFERVREALTETAKSGGGR